MKLTFAEMVALEPGLADLEIFAAQAGRNRWRGWLTYLTRSGRLSALVGVRAQVPALQSPECFATALRHLEGVFLDELQRNAQVDTGEPLNVKQPLADSAAVGQVQGDAPGHDRRPDAKSTPRWARAQRKQQRSGGKAGR